MLNQNKVAPTEKQIKTVNAVLAGETNVGKAMQEAEYSPKTSENSKRIIFLYFV